MKKQKNNNINNINNINNNMNSQIFNDEFDITKCKILFCLSDSDLLKYTNHNNYSNEENQNYIKKIKSSLKELIINNTNIIKRTYVKSGCNRIYCQGNGLQYFSNNILQFILPKNSCE